MKGNPTAGIILLVAASLLIVLATNAGTRLREAWSILRGNNSDLAEFNEGRKELEESHPTEGGSKLTTPFWDQNEMKWKLRDGTVIDTPKKEGELLDP